MRRPHARIRPVATRASAGLGTREMVSHAAMRMNARTLALRPSVMSMRSVPTPMVATTVDAGRDLSVAAKKRYVISTSASTLMNATSDHAILRLTARIRMDRSPAHVKPGTRVTESTIVEVRRCMVSRT